MSAMRRSAPTHVAPHLWVAVTILSVGLCLTLTLTLAGCSPGSFGEVPPPIGDPGPGSGGGEPPSDEPPPVYGRVLGHVVMENAYSSQAASTSSAPGVVVLGTTRLTPLVQDRGPEYSSSEFLASFRSGARPEDIRAAVEKHGYRVDRVIEGAGIYVIEVPRGVDPLRAVEGFKQEALVEHAEPNYTARVSEAAAAQPRTARIPNDTYYASQWAPEAMSLPYAWDEVTGSSGVIVAVIDTGVQTDHPDLAGRIVTGYDFHNGSTYVRDYNGHGTHVAGIIGAAANNGIGTAGVNWNVRIMPLKACDDSGSGYLDLSYIIEALRYAADHGADVVNMSFQIGGEATGEDSFMDQAIEYAYSRGVTMVAAAGNDGEPWVAYPARHPKVIAVSAVGPDLARASWSNYGSSVDVAAPGVNILSTWPTNAYASASGTSMATPHVAGLVALMIASGITGPDAIRNMLHETAMDLGAQGRDAEYGWGLVNAHAAVTRSSITKMKVFAGEDDGVSVTPHSSMASPAMGGSFAIGEVESGTWNVYAWLDVDADGMIDDGDYFGRTPGKIASNGDTITGVELRARINVASGAGSASAARSMRISRKGR